MKKGTIKLLLGFLLIFGVFNSIYPQTSSPSNLRASVFKAEVGQAVRLKWDFPDKILVKFFVYRKDGAMSDTGTFRRLEKTPMLPFFDDFNVRAGKNYTYYVTAGLSSDQQSGQSNIVEINVIPSEPAKGNITGTLISDNTNKPIQKGKVQFFPNFPTFAPYLVTSVTDSLGKFTANLIPGPYYVYATAERFAGEFYDNAKSRDLAKIVNVTAIGSTEITMSLTPFTQPIPLMLKGSVKNNQGKVIKSQIQVFRLNAYDTQKEKCNIVGTSTDEFGNYKINLRSNDTVVVFALPSSPDYLPQYYKGKNTLQEADKLVVTADLTDINFVLENSPALKNFISGQVKDSLNQGVTASVVALRINDGKLGAGKNGILTDSLGKYFLSNLRPGKYLLQVIPRSGYMPEYFRYDGKQVFERKLADTLTVSETTELKNIDFTIKKINRYKGTGLIAGFIKDLNGRGINGALSFVADEKGEFLSYAISDEKGQYIIDGLAPGTYAVIADVFEYKETGREYVNISKESEMPFVTFTMTPASITSVYGKDSAPTEYSLKQNYPNPFNPSTTINFIIPVQGFVTLKVYNILGKEITALVNEEKPAGSYSIKFNAQDIPSGIYFYTLTSGKYSETRKLILIK